jgi:lipoprotein-anchoring transpeptidase ErfK/SrfK
MSRSRAGKFGVFLLLAGTLAAVLLGRGVADGEPAEDAVDPAAPGGPGAAFTDVDAADSAQPAKPRRQIVPDVEVVVNIPSGRLQLMQGDSVVKSYPVSVGSARYPTPVGDYLLATVIWNPWWNPPPESEWARNRKRTPPGPGNPMGRVKLHMDELIYIHGTTSEGRLGAPASHGCIRMSNADVVDLALRLRRITEPSVAQAELDRISTAGRTERHTVMPRSVRMRVTYQLAQLRGDELRVFPDVYGKGGFTAQVQREMARGGLDTAQVPSTAMSRLRASAARGGARFALADVPSLQPLPPEPPRAQSSGSASEPERGPRLLGTPVSAPRAAADTIVLGETEPAAPVDTTDDEP